MNTLFSVNRTSAASGSCAGSRAASAFICASTKPIRQARSHSGMITALGSPGAWAKLGLAAIAARPAINPVIARIALVPSLCLCSGIRVILIAARDQVGVNRLDLRGRQHVGEARHASVRERALQQDVVELRVALRRHEAQVLHPADGGVTVTAVGGLR